MKTTKKLKTSWNHENDIKNKQQTSWIHRKTSWTQTLTLILIEHHAKVGNHSHISTSVVLNGDVRVGGSSFIGSGTIIKNSVVIGKRASISMGQRIFENIADNKIIKKWKQQ